jgi:hypothetical protein
MKMKSAEYIKLKKKAYKLYYISIDLNQRFKLYKRANEAKAKKIDECEETIKKLINKIKFLKSIIMLLLAIIIFYLYITI